MEFITKSAKETQRVAARLTKDLIKLRGEVPGVFVLALEGELGAGKTTFTQGLARALKIKESILSPTFVIMKRFPVKDKRLADFYHLDCYRVSDFREIMALGFGQIIAEPQGLVVIEWAEKIKDILPPDTIWLKFEHKGGDKRKIKM
ncbi:MAG TPA: tRNA (adenosine(37)-N6)-threonylcarbamoyltransferase complex ATPase subunit type 1 TsaE [Candidatus Portnoybacteria bacterium]|nr:tRNA (adenosine(37)-N6)-threonylcarbamoyltransferase complex ATPase subunit type 1 TsaE [Candidatus Portnoybacteria bacterium]